MQLTKPNDPQNRWNIDTITFLCEQIQNYTKTHGIDNAELCSIEDNTWQDVENQRYDIEIIYSYDERLIRQKLLILKNEVIDGPEFHKRFNEFYPQY